MPSLGRVSKLIRIKYEKILATERVKKMLYYKYIKERGASLIKRKEGKKI